MARKPDPNAFDFKRNRPDRRARARANASTYARARALKELAHALSNLLPADLTGMDPATAYNFGALTAAAQRVVTLWSTVDKVSHES